MGFQIILVQYQYSIKILNYFSVSHISISKKKKKNQILSTILTLDLRKSIFPFLNRELFDLRKIYVVNLKTGCPKKMPNVSR